jgi:hypothetical protein
MALLLLTTTVLKAQLPDASEAAEWKRWAVCLVILLPVAPYEIMFIFGINDRIAEMEAKWTKDDKAEVKAEEK